MKALCTEPISTGIMDGKPTYEPCGRKLHAGLPLCKHHAQDAGLVGRQPQKPPSVVAREATRKKRVPRTEPVARPSDTPETIRRRRRAANERRRREDKRRLQRRDRPPVTGLD